MNVKNKSVRIAILDLYEGRENEGMRGIREIINQWSEQNNLTILVDVFDVRLKLQVPDLSYDAYISTGGPGSPLESKGLEWDNLYMHWLSIIESYNNDVRNSIKKHVFFICHSFQLVCRYYKIGNVCKRKSTSFGVFPVHILQSGKEEIIFNHLNDPFYAVDSRDFQVIELDSYEMKKIGAEILAIEKERPHVPYERAIMAVRFNKYFIGTQFHPEADAIGMSMYLRRDDKKKNVIENYGKAKWQSMIDQLEDPDKIMRTYSTVMPNFLNSSLKDRPI